MKWQRLACPAAASTTAYPSSPPSTHSSTLPEIASVSVCPKRSVATASRRCGLSARWRARFARKSQLHTPSATQSAPAGLLAVTAATTPFTRTLGALVALEPPSARTRPLTATGCGVDGRSPPTTKLGFGDVMLTVGPLGPESTVISTLSAPSPPATSRATATSVFEPLRTGTLARNTGLPLAAMPLTFTLAAGSSTLPVTSTGPRMSTSPSSGEEIVTLGGGSNVIATISLPAFPHASVATSSMRFRPTASGTVQANSSSTGVASIPAQSRDAAPESASSSATTSVTCGVETTLPSGGSIATNAGASESIANTSNERPEPGLPARRKVRRFSAATSTRSSRVRTWRLKRCGPNRSRPFNSTSALVTGRSSELAPPLSMCRK